MNDNAPQIVPHNKLELDTLLNLIEHFVNREGTDYGDHEKSLDEKVQDVLAQLEDGDAFIVFNPEDESINIVPKSWFNKAT